MFKFKNPALIHILLLFISNTFNDFVAINFHLPVSPTQVVILYGLFEFYIHKPRFFPTDLSAMRNILYIYMAYVTVSCVVISVQQNSIQLNMITIGANALWLLGVIPLAYEGIGERDMFKFFKTITICIVVFVALPGLFELLTRHQLVKELDDDSRLFYLKGFTADKLEFGNILASGIFITMVCLLAKINKNRSFLIFALSFFSFLMLFSFSTTSILGAVTGLVYLYFKRIKENIGVMIIFALLGVAAFYFLQSSELFQGQVAEYNTKYTKNVDQAEDNNFRWLAVKAGANLFLESPLVGYGAGTNAEVIRQYLKKSKGNSSSTLRFNKAVNAHNFVINEAVDYGFIGLALLFSFVYIIFSYSFENMDTTMANHKYFFVLKQVCVCLSIFTLYRFVLYYHRFDQTFYFIWISFVIILKGTEKKLRRFDAIQA